MNYNKKYQNYIKKYQPHFGKVLSESDFEWTTNSKELYYNSVICRGLGNKYIYYHNSYLEKEFDVDVFIKSCDAHEYYPACICGDAYNSHHIGSSEAKVWKYGKKLWKELDTEIKKNASKYCSEKKISELFNEIMINRNWRDFVK